MTTFLIVRHGTTAWVDIQLLHGITDIPLNQRGREQAAAAAEALTDYRVHQIYSSPLSRCAETAQIIGAKIGTDPIMKKSLIEIDFGWLEGKKIRDHDRGEHSRLIEFLDHHYFNIVRAISGDSRSRFNKRVIQGWSEIGRENPSGTAVIVTHSGVINTILLHLFDKKYLNGNAYHHLNPCSITEVKVDPEGNAEMVRLNDLSHIPDNLR